MWPLKWPCSHLFKQPELRLDGAVTSQWSWPLERPCFHCSERAKMKSCLARERGKGGGSEHKNEHCWTFANKEKHIKNVFESDRSRLLSEVIEKPCFSTKNVSKSWAACSTLSTEKRTSHLPVSQHQTHSMMGYDPPNSPQTAVLSNPSQSLERACSHCAERKTPCQDSTAVREHSKTILRLKLCPDGAVIQEWSWSLERLCLHRSKREQPCQDGTVN